MKENRDISILLVEDVQKECDAFKEYCLTREGVELVAITNSSDKALELVKSHAPEAIILDIELNYGIGSGTKFLKQLKQLNIGNKPVIVVTTRIDAQEKYEEIRSYGVHQIIYKGKPDYSQEHVIDELAGIVHVARKMRCRNNGEVEECDTEDVRRKRIEKRIMTELGLIGIGDNLKGKRYLFEAIYYLVENGIQDIECSVMKMLTKKHKKTHSNLIGVMQTSIHHAWRKSTIETLEKQYTAIVCNQSGVPKVSEFIYYYAKKIYEYFE